MEGKMIIELTPYEACSIYKFLSEFESQYEIVPELSSFNKVFKSFEKQVIAQLTPENLNDAIMETEINQVLGTDPKSKKNKEK